MRHIVTTRHIRNDLQFITNLKIACESRMRKQMKQISGEARAAVSRSTYLESGLTDDHLSVQQSFCEIATIPRFYGAISPNLDRNRGSEPTNQAAALKG